MFEAMSSNMGIGAASGIGSTLGIVLVSRRGFARLMLVALLASGAACGRTASDRSSTTLDEGQRRREAMASVVGVVQLRGGGVDASCTGVLVAPNLVLTARHCVSSVVVETLSCDAQGSARSGGEAAADREAASLGVVSDRTSARRDARPEIAAHGEAILHPETATLCNGDIALLLLDRELAGHSIAPLGLEAAPVAGDRVAIVIHGEPVASRPILAVGRTRYALGGRLVEVASNEFLLGEGVCAGDSGGPAIDVASGSVIGVATRGGNGYVPRDATPSEQAKACADFEAGGNSYKAANVFTRVDAFRGFLLRGLAVAGARDHR